MERQPPNPRNQIEQPNNLQIDMEEQTLKELWVSLDPNEQANMLRFFGAKLFVSPQTAICYLRGYRKMPVKKRPALTDYAAKTDSVKLKFS